MCPTHYTITPKEIYRYAASVLQPHLRWQDYGPKCTVTTLLRGLFYAAAQLCSVFAACGRLRDAPSDQAVTAMPWRRYAPRPSPWSSNSTPASPRSYPRR
jgi:hypothetical protein